MSQNARLIQELERAGYRARIVSADRLADLRENIEAGRRAGLYDEDLYREYLGGFVYGPPADLPGARSIIVIATPQRHVSFTFARDGGKLTAVVPATYLHSRETDRKAQETLAGLLAPAGYRVAPTILPKKLLAVRSGLAAYGRNNVTYVPGLGSFHRLSAFFSDMPCDGDEWHEPAMMGRCDKCSLCYTMCPTGAIEPDRFLLHAERCIVFHNEKPWTVSFPSWLDPSWHNCLVGCLLCQSKCPENRDLAGVCQEGATFSPDETELLLSGMPLDRLPAPLAKKLEEYDLASMLEVFPRNLKALFERAKEKPGEA
jgi:epoxyqueuosine reductase